ncbi:PspC domain-containing protein [Nocardioides xinjiangensis]|uniref:PspC domain-containing protein n=1 Tax=Nocardioides xinjiangensis TaxID=2817376 RepID=UPI001B3054FC|nr:PspC domain-containing protein [Nocardioides sp. SYSU D00514]
MDNASPTTGTGAEQPPTGDRPPTGPPSGPRVTREEMKDLGRLRRSVTDRHVAGVAAGIARHLDIDAIIVRVALVVAVFFGGAGLLLYIGAWILVPEEGTQDEPLGLDERSRTLALAGVGVLAVVCALGDWAGAFWFPWPLAIIAALVVWFLHNKQKGAPARGAAREGYGTGYGTGHGYGWGDERDDGWDDAAPAHHGVTTAYGPVGEPGQWSSYAPAPRPRKRGPRLFLFTLALVALAEGVLGVIDLAGIAVADSAYPALALGIVAAMLLVGSFWGRAGGLIALGLVAAAATAVATVGSQVDDEDRSYAPTSAAEVQEAYEFGGGRFTLDLSDVEDLDALDGRDLTIDGFGGEVEVVVPDGVDVDVRAQVAAGDVRVLDRNQDGFDITVESFRDGGDDVPDLSVTIDLFAGEVLVREAA